MMHQKRKDVTQRKDGLGSHVQGGGARQLYMFAATYTAMNLPNGYFDG